MISFKNNGIIKKLLSLSVVSVMMLGLVACSKDESKGNAQNQNNVQNVIDQQVASEEEKTAETTTEATTEVTTEATTEVTTEATTQAPEPTTEGTTTAPPDSTCDIDLTVMDSNMVYSTVYQMMSEGDKYVGQVVKMKGQYYMGKDEETGAVYHFVLIKDALACCQQGMEFIWEDGSHKYPDEYPADGTEVVVKGTYELYKDDPNAQYNFCRLGNSSLEVVENND
ncbi:MAG: hypothetical protein K5865_04055 [Eubacterium sp.]|nr:hypothetical protein [Eubacterium sp.]